MSETANTAALATKVFNDIFSWLKWQVCTAKDINWQCHNQEKHNKATHPSDIVFYYKNPYTDKTIYINTDLKSYKKISITKNGTTTSLKSLAMSIECAKVSKEWQNNYTHDENYDIHGLLFIYNYDNSYNSDFNKEILNKINTKNLDIPKSQFIAIFTPSTIQYLLNVCDDLKEIVRKHKKLDADSYNFFYPNQRQAKTHTLDFYPATLEYILSPFMIIHILDSHEYIVYYQALGETVEEFIYLIDTLAVYQLLNDRDSIQIVLNQTDNCMSNFNIAKRRYAEQWSIQPNDSALQNLNARVLTLKNHYYDPKNERMSHE